MSTTAAEYAKSDSALAASEDFKKAYAKYHEVPSADVIEKAKAGLEKNNHKVTVVANKEEALKTLVSLIPDGVSIHNTSSTTLNQIGFIDYLKSNESKWNNMHSKVIAEKDQVKASVLRRQAQASDYAISSVDAITEEGHFCLADASGTRIAVVHAAGQVIFVVGANKIVADDKAASDRIHNYSFQLESARVRAAYGWPSSCVANELHVNTQLAMLGTKFHFIIVKETLGF